MSDRSKKVLSIGWHSSYDGARSTVIDLANEVESLERLCESNLVETRKMHNDMQARINELEAKLIDVAVPPCATCGKHIGDDDAQYCSSSYHIGLGPVLAKLAKAETTMNELLTETNKLRSERNAVVATVAHGTWIWDDEDACDLESFASDAAVTMRAEQLRALITKHAPAKTPGVDEHVVCWHCLTWLIGDPRPHCEQCPPFRECDDPDCEEPGCEDDMKGRH